MNKRIVMTTVLILVFVLSACKPKEQKPLIPEKFVFSTWGDATLYEDCFQRLQKRYPEYASVKFENVQADSDATLYQRLITDFTAKSWDTIPDMVEMTASRIPELSDAGVLVDLTAWMKPFQGKIGQGVLEGVSRNGKVYAVPWMANSAMVWYREDVFKEAGIDANKIETWDDFLAGGKTIASFSFADGKKHYLLSQSTGGIDTMRLQLMMDELDTNIFDPQTGAVSIDTDPKFRRAAEMMVRMATEGVSLEIAEWEAAWFAALGDGTIVAYVSANWMGQIIQGGDLGKDQQGKWRAMALPAFDKGGSRAALEGNSANVVILNKQGGQKDLAWLMAKTCFLDNEITADLMNVHNLGTAYMPALQDKRFTDPVEFFGGQAVGVLDRQIQEKATRFYYTAGYFQAMDLISEQLNLAIKENKNLDQAIKDAANNIRTKVGTSK
jgi:lactose/L-arabinose transport system substrate-binding protein